MHLRTNLRMVFVSVSFLAGTFVEFTKLIMVEGSKIGHKKPQVAREGKTFFDVSLAINAKKKKDYQMNSHKGLINM